MNIVIIGAGEVGRTVAKTLSGEGHNIYIVEKDEAQAKNAGEQLDVQVVNGNGARPNVLAQAGVVPSGDVDLLIACTDRDEVNMLSCWIAHSAGVPNVISRVRSLEFTDSADWGKKLGIDAMISPERSIAREIISLLEVTSATYAAELLDGRAALYTLKIAPDSPLVDVALKDLRTKFPDLIAVFVHNIADFNIYAFRVAVFTFAAIICIFAGCRTIQQPDARITRADLERLCCPGCQSRQLV